jgi:hypothetical protein
MFEMILCLEFLALSFVHNPRPLVSCFFKSAKSLPPPTCIASAPISKERTLAPELCHKLSLLSCFLEFHIGDIFMPVYFVYLRSSGILSAIL